MQAERKLSMNINISDNNTEINHLLLLIFNRKFVLQQQSSLPSCLTILELEAGHSIR